MSLKNKEVLIIDDDSEFRAPLRRALEGSGLLVRESDGVGQAFVEIEKRLPHVILTDLNMPEEDGFNFLERAREFGLIPKIPILVLSSVQDKSSVYKAIALGASDYILKPFRTDLVLKKLNKALSSEFEYAQVELGSKHDTKVTAQVAAKLVEICEAGFKLETSVKIPKNTSLEIKSNLIDEVGFMGSLFQTSGAEPKVLSGVSRYQHEVVVVGLPESTAQKIRTKIRNWSR